MAAKFGVNTPEVIDTGFVHITKDMIPENVKEWKGFRRIVGNI